MFSSDIFHPVEGVCTDIS